MNDFTPSLALDALLRHMPTDIAWVPAAAAGLAIVLGLLLMVRGARLVPALVSAIFAASGVYAGLLASQAFGTSPGPTTAAGGLIGLILGFLFFRLWVAGLVAGLFVAVALTVYGARVLQGPLGEYGGRLKDQGGAQLVSLKEPATTQAAAAWQAVAAELWTYLGERVPTFQASFYAIVISAGVAGLLLGLLLPRVARSVCAATLGTPLLLAAAYALLHGRWPQADAWFDRWGVTLAAILWGLSLIYNLADMLGIRPKKHPPVAKPASA
jgi:hypothetical protein